MAYGHTIKKRNSKKNRAATRQLEPRVVLASLAMAAGIFVAPFGIAEAAIVDKNGATINPDGNVYNITPEGTNSGLAYNRFQQFALDSGYIANLQFGGADTLANLVNNRISIDGIVNGIKNGQIDGHLIFLSPEGIAVGAHGVINAGQFTGIVPTPDAFKTLYGTTNPATDITLAAINKLIEDGSYAAVKTDADGNKQGTIDVNGKINTHSGVMLGAGIININTGAEIKNMKNVQLTDVVNTTGMEGLAFAASEKDGDIILTAKQTSDVKDTKTVKENDQDKEVANAIRWGDRSTDLSAAVNIGKGVTITNSDGAVKLTAESKSTYEDSTPMTLTQTLKGIVLGDENTLLDGVINKLANKEAANNKYLFVNYSNKKNKSSVNVGEGSTITGNTIDIAANSTLEIKQSVVAAVGKKDSEGKTSEGSKAIAAVAVSRVYNSADVVIDGKLEATGADTTAEDGTKISALQISANADTKAALSATGNGGNGNAVAVGVAVLTGDTKAKVTVNNPANADALTATKGKVSIDATTKSDVDITVNAVGQQNYVVSNVGMANYDTNADVTINGSIKAGAVDLNAENTITGLKMTVDNTVKPPSGDDAGKDALETSDEDKQKDNEAATKENEGKSGEEKQSEKNAIDPTKVLKDANVDTSDDKTKDAAGSDGKGGVQDVKDKLEGSNDGGDNANKNSAFGLGAAVGVLLNENNANVTLGKNAAITATKVENSETANGAVNVGAKTIMQSSAEKEDSLALSVKNAQANANVEIGAAVLVSNMKNNATVLLDNEGDNSAQIKGGAVSIDAAAGMGKYKKDNEEKTSTLAYTVSAEGKAGEETPSTVALNGSVGVNTLKNNAIVLLGQNSKVEGSSVKLSSDATTNAEGTYGATDENSKVAIGGTVGLQNIRGNSLVMAGKGADIKGTDSFEASAENSMDLKNSVKNAGKGDSIGISGMLALSYGDSNSVVSLDDEANINAPGTLTITSTNSTNIDNSARSESTGNEGAKAFGIGVGIVNYDVNSLAMVADNGKGITAPSAGTTDAEKAAKKISEDAILAQKIAGDALAGKLGDKTTGDAKGTITTGGLIGAAVTTGMIQNDAKAKAVSSAPSDEDENSRKDSETWTKWSKKGKEGATEAKKNTEDLEEDKVISQNESAAPSASGAAKEANKAANPDETPADSGSAPSAGSHESAGASIGVEGSVALTFLGGRTDAVLDNVTVQGGRTEAGPAPVLAVSMSATDFLGSITLGGTDVKNSMKEGSGTKVGIGGAFAMNSVNRDVDSLLRKSDLPMALMVSNSATKIGIEVAAGMGVSTAEGDGANINGAGVVYYNKAKQDVHALMIDNTVMGASVSNQATDTDFQIAGGLAATKGSGSNTNVGVGGAVAISNLENNLKSGIIGGNYTVLSSVDVEAQKGTTQVSGALAGTKGGYGFEGAFAYGSTKNTTRAYIEGDATITGLSGSAVNVKAGEIPVVTTDAKLTEEKTTINSKIDSSLDAAPTTIDATTNYTVDAEKKNSVKTELTKQADDALDKEKKAQDENKKTLDDKGFDTTGEGYLDKSDAAKSSLDEGSKETDGGRVADEAAKDEDDAKSELGQNRNITITAAMGGGWNDSVGAGAGIAYNYVKNDVAADIKGSTITADAVSGEAASDALIVSVGAGAAIGGKTFNGAGSGSWNDLKNDTKVTFENNTIKGKSISEQAQNSASIINIAGEVAGGSGSALGLSLAYNSLNNTAGTYLKGNTVTLQDEGEDKVTLATANTGKALAVAGGVTVEATSKGLLGASGTVAINRGVNNTESVVDGKTTGENTKLDNVKELSVTAQDLTKKTTVAGGVSVGGVKVGIGGSVAYTSVGTSGNKEKLRAEINHADVTTTNDGTITVSTTDNKDDEKSRVTTVGAGIGVEWGKSYFNIQGAAAVSDIYKDSRASLNNTNINKDNENAHPAVSVTADSKSKINTVGAVGNISVSGKVSGTAGVAINRINQDATAEMATSRGTTAVNAGLTEVRATGDADIHSVGVGGTVAVNEYVSFSGSGSYNYIGNNVDAIIKNQNLKSDHSVGVVAQSDDRLYNFAGAFAIGANTRAGIGAAVSINKITGSTNALVSGGSLTAADSGSIKVTRPQDSKLFSTDSLDLTTDRTRLSESRQKEEKTGVVVDSSATHTLISQMSSGGVAASSSVGVQLDGTVNLNTVEGKTTAKIQDTDVNSDGNASDVSVNAVDYANIGSFTGTPAIGAGAALGLSIGVSANWETLGRTTAAELSASSANAKKNVYAKNLTVDAIAKHGSSALSCAAAAGGGKVGISSGDSIMRHKYTNTVSTLMENVNAEFDGKAEVQAKHLGNSHSQNISASVSAGMVAVSVGAGVSVMDDTSKVTSEVKGSDLKAKTSEAGKNISVQATNENNWKNTLVTASLAVGIGGALAANVGVNNTSGETAALVTNSNLKAYDVAVKAEDKLAVKSTGGVGAGGVGGVGVAVAVNNINSSTSAHVTGGSVTAANDIDVAAEEKRSFDSQVTGASAGGIGVGVNVAVTSINKGIKDAQLSNATDENGKSTGISATTQNEINKHLTSVNNAKGSLGVSGAKFSGLSASDSDLAAARNTSVSLSTPTYAASTPDTRKMGVHTSVSGAALTAAENVNVKATDTSDIFARNVGVTAAGAASVNVTDAIIHTNYDTDVTMNNATVTGKNVNVNALQTQNGNGSEVKVTAVTVGALGGVGVGYAGIVNKGAADVNISDSTVKATAGNVAVSALDESKHNSQILSVGVAALNVTTTFASVENGSNVGVTLGGTNNISAAKDAKDEASATGNITIDAKKANTLNAHTQGVGVGGVNVAVNHATIEDKGNATAKITETTNITGADANSAAEKFHLGAANDTTAKLSAGNTAVSVLGVSRMRGKGVMDMGADVSVAGGSFNAKTVEFASSLGTANGRTLEGNVKGHNISAVAVAPDAVILDTTATSNINVANSTFGENTDLVLANQSYVDRKAYIYDVTAGAVAVGNTSADIYGKETMNTSLTGKSGITSKLASMEIVTYGENKGKAFADAGGGSLVGYIGAHVANESTNNVTSSLGGKWNVAGGLSLIAAQKDETRLTASEGHGGVIGVGGTSVDNTVTTTTDAKVADGTEITADRVHIGTSNALATGAYDDTNANGATDNQTYTLKDHFGGVISGNRLRSLLNVTENGTVTVGTNAKITTNKLQEYIAASQNNLTNDVQAKGGGAVVVTDAVTENKIYTHNTVDVKGGAVLSNEKEASTEDITLSAYDNQTLKAHSDATVQAGVVSPLVATNETTMDRVNAVNVAGTIESGSNVNLYAGTDEKGAKSNLNVDLKAGAYNYSVIPITSPTVDYTLKADKGTVNVSGTVRSTKDINAFADVGRESIVKDETKWAWVTGGKTINKKFLSSDAVTAEESLPKTSSVTVTGALIAGTADPINVTIGGSVAGGLTITADDNDANKRVIKGVTQGTFDYVNTLSARLAELDKLIAAYNGDNSVMASYISERATIKQKMDELGTNTGSLPVYYVEIPDIATSGGNINVRTNDLAGTGNLHANSAPAVTITNESDAYLKLNNILMGEQGGSINYGETVIPPGRDAGNAKINELNVSSGKANFREIYGRTEATAPDLKVLNTKTFSGGKTSTVTLTDARKQQMKQEVESDKELSEEAKAQLKADIDRQTSFTYTAIPDVEVNGKISNFYGNVTINNASGDIRISGGTKERPTGVEGNTVTLVAAHGTIAQDYKEGIVNINGDPEKYLVDLANTMKSDLPLKDDATDARSDTKNYTRSDSSNTATGYIAGRDVYVSASNVNVNGLIQSGYKNYTATVTQTDLEAAQKRPADRAAIVQNRTMYKVNEGGAKWNGSYFDYVPQVYWDPSTDQLFVEDIDTAGGKVYLTGKIASTGDGRILAADGAAIITVENQTALDMNVGSVLNNQREGVITIADTAKNTWTEYKKGQTRTITGYAGYLEAHKAEDDPYAHAVASENDLSTTKGLTYNVASGQTYSWVNGNSVETTSTYEHYVRKGLWGAIETVNEEGLKEWAKDSTPISKSEGARLGLPEGAVITQGSGNALGSGQLHLDGSTRVLNSEVLERTHDEWRSGFLGWFKHSRDRWKVGTSTIQLYNYTMNASQDISIGLIGDTTGQIDIKSTNANSGSINLTGNVANSHNAATLSVSSAAGGIAQFDNTTLKSEIVTLTAKNDIKNIHLTSIGSIEKDAEGNIVKDDKGNPVVTDNIKLTAVSSGKGDIDITAVGGLLENQSLPGNVEIVALKSRNGDAAFDSNADLGDVTLTANGNITQSGNDTTVTGRGINLTSKNGGIGTAEKAIQIAGSDLVYSTDRYGAQVNASAQGDIYLTEAEVGGDMRVGKIESKTGDVTLTVKDGAFIDGLPGNDKSGSTDSVDEMVHRWIDAGLIAGEGNYVGAYVEGLRKNRADYEANVRAAYDGKTQAQWQAEYNDQKPAVEAIYASAEYRTYLANKKKYDELTQDQRKALADSEDSDFAAYAKSGEQYSQYAKYATADEYLKDTAAYKYSQHASADDYLANDATYTDLKKQAENPTYEWTKEMMLYAVSDKMVNPENGGSAQTDRAANVLGKNITLASTKGAVGSVSDQVETIEIAALDNDNPKHIENMKKLMNAGASDVTAVWNDDGDLTEFQIRANMPLGVNATGTLDVTAGGNVSVAGRKNEAGDYSAMNVKNIDATQNGATGDVRLYSENGITNALEDANGINIKGNNLIVTGGTESIGTAEKPLTVSLTQNTGDLVEARAEKNVFIKNMNSSDYLRLGAMFAKDTISLTSEKGFLMSSANSGIAESYINAGKKLEFNTNKTTGIVGNEERAIRILNDRAPVNIAAKSAYVKGMKDGTLVLGTVDTKDEFVAESEGSLTVGREEEKNSAGTVVKTAVEGRVNAGGDATLTAADDLTLDGTTTVGSAETAKTLTLTATNGSITQTDNGAITADKVNTFNGKSLLLENTENKFNSLTVDSGSESDIGGDVRVRDNSDALTVKINQKTAGDISVQNLKTDGTLKNVGNLTATGNLSLGAKGNLTQAADTTFTAGKDVTMASASGSVAQEAGDTTGVAAQKLTAISAKDVDLQGAGNAFSLLTVDSSAENTPIEGSVSVKDSADKLTLSVQPAIRGNITVENTKTQGTLNVISELHANGNGETDIKGDISLKSDGSMQTDKTMDAAGDVKLTATHGDVAINGDISTGALMPSSDSPFTPGGGTPYNYLSVTAGGAVKEAAGVKIDTPVVQTATGKGVSMESENNTFSAFFVKGLGDGTAIDGSVKAATSYYKNSDDDTFTVGIREAINGDAAFTNLHENGDLGVLSWDANGVSNNAIQVNGGNGAKGDLALTASQDVMILNGINAKHDILVENTGGGSFYGVGKALTAGNDVSVSAGDRIIYIGATVEAGHDISMEVKSTSSEHSGIHIGDERYLVTLPGGLQDDETPTDSATKIIAGNDASFTVKGNGDIDLRGYIEAVNGQVVANISQKGDIFVGDENQTNPNTITAQKDVVLKTNEGAITLVKSVVSLGESVSVETGKGDIVIGDDNDHYDETITANKNATIGTDLGTVTIRGRTSTENGDITMKAGKDVYESGWDKGNFIIEDNGKVFSGGGITLNGRNGDILITDFIEAGKGITVNIAEQGDAAFGMDVSVEEDISIATDKGDITVGQTLNSEKGEIRLRSGSGDILVGQDITAGKDITISSAQGDIAVGDAATDEHGVVVDTEGDVLSKGGNVSIETGKGTIGISRTVTAQEGSIGISSGEGDILIGNNGPDVKTVTAKQNLDLTVDDGKIVVYGKTSTEEGDITLSAQRKTYVPGGDNSTFIIDQNGKLEAGGKLNLNVGNGDLHVSDRIQSKEDLTAELTGKGSVYFDTDVNVDGNVSIKADEGDINVGNEVQATKDIAMTTNTGNIKIDKAITSTGGSIGVSVGTGNVTIGDNGPDVETVTAKDNINMAVDLGKIIINGKTSTQTGDIAMSAGDSHYTPGVQNIVIGLNGQVDSGRDVNLQGRNGDLHVTDAIQVKRDLYGQVTSGGGVFFEQSATLPGDLVLSGNFIVADSVNATTNGTVFNFTATGAIPDKLITEDFYVGSLKSKYGTEMPSLWTNRGYLHVDEGDTTLDDALAVDKIYMDNEPTNLAIFGRTPTRDGEQLVYWNNLDMANDKTRSFQLYTDGTLRTHGAVLIDAERYYTKLYGDNLSVVDMMRDHVTHERGEYTFDSKTLTEPGRLVREPVFFGMESTDVVIQQRNATDAEIMVES